MEICPNSGAIQFFPSTGISKADAYGATNEYKYDDLDRVLTETINQPGVKEHILTRSYNDTGKSSGFEWNKGKDQLQVDYGYHTSGRLNTISDGETKVTYEYLANSNLIEQITYHNQNTTTMRTAKQYDRLGRLLGTATRRLSDTAILSSHQYTYNLVNQRTTALDDNGNQWSYKYDTLGQIISGQQTNTDGQALQSHTYDLDTIGNRKRAFNQGLVKDYEANNRNQYESRKSTENGKQTHTVYRYDEDGNLIQDDIWTYEWDAENRLVAMESQVAEPLQRLEFRYDPQGRRIQKAVFESKPEKGEEKKLQNGN